MDKLSNSVHFLDISALDLLRGKVLNDDKDALREVAQQFEGIFIQMLMKNMRAANAAFKSDSPMNSEYTEFYEQMHDQQMSLNLSDKGMLGLADLLVRQLSPGISNITPASVLRGINERDVNGMPRRQALSMLDRRFSTSDSTVVKAQLIFDRIITGKNLPSQAVEALQAGTALAQKPVAAPVPTNASTDEGVKSREFNTREDFVAQLYPHAQKAAAALGTQAEVLIAQSALETGWGQKMVKRSGGDSSNNLFNIKTGKGWQGDKAQVYTLEFEQGIAVQQRADFRVYDDIKQSFDDFIALISAAPRYREAIKQAANPGEFVKALQEAGYATDPNYASKVIEVMKSVISDLKSLKLTISEAGRGAE